MYLTKFEEYSKQFSALMWFSTSASWSLVLVANSLMRRKVLAVPTLGTTKPGTVGNLLRFSNESDPRTGVPTTYWRALFVSFCDTRSCSSSATVRPQDQHSVETVIGFAQMPDRSLRYSSHGHTQTTCLSNLVTEPIFRGQTKQTFEQVVTRFLGGPNKTRQFSPDRVVCWWSEPVSEF